MMSDCGIFVKSVLDQSYYHGGEKKKREFYATLGKLMIDQAEKSAQQKPKAPTMEKLLSNVTRSY